MQADARRIDRAELRRLIQDAITRAGGAKALAAGAGINVSNLHAYRRGVQTPRWETVARIAAAGGIGEADLLRASGWGDRAGEAPAPSRLSVLEARFEQLSIANQDLFIRIARSVIKELEESK